MDLGFDNIFGSLDFMDSLGAAAGFFIVIVALLGLFFTVAAYVFPRYTLMTLGRKARAQSDWMPFVPFADDVYKLRIVKNPIWHLFFFGACGFLAIFLFDLILVLIALRQTSPALYVIAALITLAWLVFRYYVTFGYYQKLYKGFGFNPMLALVFFVPGLSQMVQLIIEVIIAYKADIEWNKRPVASPAPIPVPNPVVPDMNQPVGSGRMSALSGMYAGAVFSMKDNEDLTFGRDPMRCQIIFDDKSPEVSKCHCSVRYSAMGNKYIVTDYSKNGTFTDDNRRLQPNMPVALPAGATIYLGSRKNSFRLG